MTVELRTGAKLLAVRSDNALELKFILGEWCSTIGIEPQYTEAYTSRQNGIPKGDVRTTENNIRPMIKEAGLLMEFWSEAAAIDAYIRNRVGTGPVVNGERTTPIEAFEGVKPSIDHMRTWACVCYSPVDPKSLPVGTRKDKIMDRGRRCVFLGYVEETDKQYWMWAPDLKRVIKHHKVTFSENEKWGNEELNLPFQTPNELPVRRPVGRPKKLIASTTTGQSEVQMAPEPATGHADEPPEEVPSNELNLEGDHMDIDEERVYDEPDADESDYSPEGQPPEQDASPTRKSARQMASNYLNFFVPKRKRSGPADEEEITEHRAKITRAMTALLTHKTTDNETEEWALIPKVGFDPDHEGKLVIPVPETYEVAIRDPVWGSFWLEAVQAELTALIANGTWDVVVPPEGVNIVTSKWVFKAKMHIDGSLEKLKARLVARGFSQVWGVDFTDTFTPTFKFDALRLFLIIVALEDLERHQVDVKNAFTESFLEEKVYMRAPPGISLLPGQALLIRRSLYGLKQAARDWHEKCVRELKKLVFEKMPSDPCLLRHPRRNISTFILTTSA